LEGKPLIHGPKVGRWVAAGFILFLVLYLFAGDYGFYKIGTLWLERKKLKLEITFEQARFDSLNTVKEKLLKDDKFMEKIARENLGMVKEGETVYRFLEQVEDKK
jgi:cell division protein FtsB